MVTNPIDGQPAAARQWRHARVFRRQHRARGGWHKAGRANGGTAIEEPPGIRKGGFGDLYLAYLRDPDGNKLCALHRAA
jgi:hypothetical protein